MQYYEMFPGMNVSRLGFGVMRMPQTEDGQIDRELSMKMLKKAYDAGVNYYDTAQGYHDGDSKYLVGEFIDTIDRSTVYVANKMPMWGTTTLEKAKEIFQEQLDACRVEYFDNYLLHSVNREVLDSATKLGVIDYLFEEKEAGRIKHLGFSFHDTYEVFIETLDAAPWEFCQLQINYVDTEIQAGLKGMRLAAERGLPVIVMEPVKGGNLAVLPEDAMAVLEAVDPEASASSWALRYVADFDEVALILSGMSAMDHVEDNLKTFIDYKPLDDEDRAAIDRVQQIFNERSRNGCTTCQYCMPCPFGVNIPGNFEPWNHAGRFGNFDGFMNREKAFREGDEDQSPLACTECGACIPLCPQGIPIPDDLKRLEAEYQELLAKA